MPNIYKIVVTAESRNTRLDILLTNSIPNITRSKIKYLIENGNAKLFRNNSLKNDIEAFEIIASPSYKVKLGEIIEIYIEEKIPENILPQKMDIEVLYEDEYLVIINKPAGLVVHPGAGNWDNTLVNGLLYKYNSSLSSVNGIIRPGIIHRLDKNTSGVLAIAKDDLTHAKMATMFSKHNIIRAYRCLVWGVPSPKKGTIKTFIKRSSFTRTKMTVHKLNGKEAITHYTVQESFNGLASLLDVKLETGRTHQIRVHLSHLGYPIVGDSVYGSDLSKFFNKLTPEIQTLIKNLHHQALHAYKLGFTHPIKGTKTLIEKTEPQDLQIIYNALRKTYS